MIKKLLSVTLALAVVSQGIASADEAAREGQVTTCRLKRHFARTSTE
jgi:hypothetical protein